jgi:hypothetical protein
MAGSYRHITNGKNEFIGIDLIDNLGDAWEALEECYLMIKQLTGNDKQKIYKAWYEGVLGLSPNVNSPKFTYDRFWEE